MNRLNLRTTIMVLLPLLVICLAVTPNVQATSMMATINKPPQMVSVESAPSCSILPLAFSAHKDDIITGTFGSDDVPINFYILTQNDLDALQNCHLSASARPLFIEENIAGIGLPYRTIPIPANGTYYFVFLYVGNSSPVQLTSSYDTVRLSVPASLTVTAPANVTLTKLS